MLSSGVREFWLYLAFEELQEKMHVNHSQASHSGDSDVAIPRHSPKMSEPLDAAEEEPNQYDITPRETIQVWMHKRLVRE